MYMELHDALLLIELLEGKYDIDHNKLPQKRNSETRQEDALEIRKCRLKKCDLNFWVRAPKLLNIIQKNAGTKLYPNKKKLTDIYKDFFLRCYNDIVSCTWRILCSGGSCNPHQKLVPDRK